MIGLYLSYDRGALLGLIIALPFFFFRKYKKKFIQLMAGFLVALVLIGGSLLVINSQRGDGSTWFTINASGFKPHSWEIRRFQSMQLRWAQYKTAIMVAMERPLTGIGYRNFEPNSMKLKQKWNIGLDYFVGDAHNNFLEQLASTGVPGLIALLLFHLFWFIEMYRRNDWIGDTGVPLVVSLFVSGQFQTTLWDGENLFVIMLLYGLSQTLPRLADDK